MVFARTLFPLFILALAFVLSGCSSLHLPKPSILQSKEPTREWYLNKNVELSHYRSYGFIQVTAARYSQPKEKKRSLIEKVTFRNEYKDEPMVVHHTDEVIWRTIQEDMNQKGYAQVAPQEADLWVIYYGGPRPQRAPANLMVNAKPFDSYFCENELTKDTFFVDIIDAKTGDLLFRGWDNNTFYLSKSDIKHQRAPDGYKVISAVDEIIGFFPSRGY